MFLRQVDQLGIIEIVSSLHSGTGGGYDCITMQTIKDSINMISELLTPIVNLSLKSGFVPQQMKVACVIPVYKSCADHLFSNYRQISVIPAFSKI